MTGRDVAEAEYALTLADVGRWKIDGADLAEAAMNAAEVRTTAGLGDRSAETLRTSAAPRGHDAEGRRRGAGDEQ